MAGCSVIESEGTQKEKAENNRFVVEREQCLKGFGLKTQPDKTLKCWFDNFVKSFTKEICVIDKGIWRFPPMLGNGQSVDLLKLFLVVREKGGGDAVSKNALWDLVAKEFGLDLNLASSLKLVYVKYLVALEGLLEDRYSKSKSVDSASKVDTVLTELGAKYKGFSTEMLNSKDLESVSESNMSIKVVSSRGEKLVVDYDIHNDFSHLRGSVANYVKIGKLCNGGGKDAATDSLSEGDKKCKDVKENLQDGLTKNEKPYIGDEMKIVAAAMDGGKFCNNADEVHAVELGSDVDREVNSCHKRKRESMCRMLNWVSGIAKDPCNPIVDSLPDLSNWNSYGNEEIWKQVLLVRKALSNKGNDFRFEQCSWQKNMKMHPCMYDDPAAGPTYNFRERLRSTKKIHSEQSLSQAQRRSWSPSSASQTDSNSSIRGICDVDSLTEHSILDLPVEKQIPLGPRFQAEVKEWTGVVSESDTKWNGNRLWPQEISVNKSFVERVPIGKGRQDSCGCQVPKSIECVRFHNTEQTLRLKCELGSAFYFWRINRMGEKVKLLWTDDDEKKFKAIVRSNRPSLGKFFWDEILKSFPTKRREDLVSYYYNVFLLQRRAHQNRFTPNNIDSDDDDEESEYVTKSTGSILKKPRKTIG